MNGYWSIERLDGLGRDTRKRRAGKQSKARRLDVSVVM